MSKRATNFEIEPNKVIGLDFVLGNYFEDVLSLVDQSSDICDEILDCWFLSFNIFLWIIQIKQTFIAYDFGVLPNKSHLYGCEVGCFHESFKAGFSKAFHEFTKIRSKPK